MRDTSAAGYVRGLVPTLWPAPATVHMGGGGRDAARSYVVVPSMRRPKLLVPAGSPRAGATAVRHGTGQRSGRARVRTAVLATLFRTGLGSRVFGARLHVKGGGTIEDHLGAVLGRPVLLSLHIGPARANRKPVFQVLDRGGAPLAFAKIGVDPLTRRLVDDEARALGVLAGRRLLGLEVPTVLHHGTWNGATVLIQSPLPVWLPRVAAADRVVAAMVEVAGLTGVHDEPVDGPYSSGLADRVAAVTDRPGGTALALTLDSLVAGGGRLRIGCWHGDWNVGNTAVLADRLLVWDWERFGAGVPVGYDALHHGLQTAITVLGVPPERAAAELVLRAPALLAPFGVPAAGAAVVAALYLVELGARYLADGQAEAGARLGRLDDWLTPVLGRLWGDVG